MDHNPNPRPMGPPSDDQAPFGAEEAQDRSEAWVPTEAIEALTMEKDLHPDEDNAARANRILDENAPAAASAIVHMAVFSKSERTRLDAAKYVVDRKLGRIGELKSEGAADILAQFFGEVEDAANKSTPTPTSNNNTPSQKEGIEHG